MCQTSFIKLHKLKVRYKDNTNLKLNSFCMVSGLCTCLLQILIRSLLMELYLLCGTVTKKQTNKKSRIILLENLQISSIENPSKAVFCAACIILSVCTLSLRLA